MKVLLQRMDLFWKFTLSRSVNEANVAPLADASGWDVRRSFDLMASGLECYPLVSTSTGIGMPRSNPSSTMLLPTTP